ASAELVLKTHDNVWKLPAAARGVRLEPSRQTESAREKIARWDARADRSSWQLVWARDGNAPPPPLYPRLAGKSANGDAAIEDGQWIEGPAWEPDEKAPSADQPARVLLATPADKSEKGLKLF